MAKSILQIQPFRSEVRARIEDQAGRQGEATLIDLQPGQHRWLVLRLDWEGAAAPALFHLENPDPEVQRVELSPRYLHGLELEAAGRRRPCDLWSDRETGALAAAAGSQSVFAPLCGGRLYLRNSASGRKTAMEWTTDFLRDYIWRGEQITVFVRRRFFQDAFLETSEVLAAERSRAAARPRPAGAPLRPLIDPRFEGHFLVPTELGLDPELNGAERRLLVGRWYPIRGVPSVFVSALRPNLVAPELLDSLKGLLNPLDEVESSALVYAVAFDLDAFDLGFALGTEHPRLGWSERVPEPVRDSRLPGPDGFDSAAPLERTGMVSPVDRARLAATFTGGFKRSHGAFRAGELSRVNGGSHYGFIEQGAIFSKLQPGLATMLVLDDGTVDLRTWREGNEADLPRIRHARQNGLPLVERDEDSGRPRPGGLVPNWTLGNWSGSVDKRLRALRAGACLQESEEGRFLIYGYFSTATPSAMARVFLAYRCRYALLLDMNALEHTYLALYKNDGSDFRIQHLIAEMKVLDQEQQGRPVPRFVGFADNRDFFYLLRKEGP